MRTTKLIRLGLSRWNQVLCLFAAGVAVILVAMVLFAGPGDDPELKVLKMGLGSGRVTSDTSTAGVLDIDCGTACDHNYGGSPDVTLTAVAAGDSTFLGWDLNEDGTPGPTACTLTSPTTCRVTLSAARSIRAKFGLTLAIPPITDFTPEGIRDYLANVDPAHTAVNTAARFIAALPPDFKQNWILMSRSESLQPGVAESPRILLPSATAQYVFTIGMTPHSSYPGADPNAVEYMQWDPIAKNFRFHEIVLAPITELPRGCTAGSPGCFRPRIRHVEIDDHKCANCHSTRNVLNRTTLAGTTGITPGTVPFKNKPNWDSYDSWGGAMPFNRDRIYQGSVEEASFRHIFNLWNWRNSPTNDSIRQVLEQLKLQASYVPSTSPHSITRDLNSTTDNAHIRFGFDGLPVFTTTSTPVGYSFDLPGASPTPVTQGGRYVTLRHSNPNPVPGSSNDGYAAPGSDEGRAVQFFDLLAGSDNTLDLDGDSFPDGSFNAQRIADELINHRFATGSFPNVSLDVRPLALAIIKTAADGGRCIRVSGGAISSTPAISPPILDFLLARNGRLSIADVVADTRNRSESLPRRKADIQKRDLDRSVDPYLMGYPTPSPSVNGLIQKYGDGTSAGTDTSLNRLRQEVFRRPIDLGRGDRTVMGGIYVDRERYGSDRDPASINYTDLNTEKLAMYRYFLEPLGVSVDKWSMGVRGRSRTYTFADVFESHENVLIRELERSLRRDPRGLTLPDLECGSLLAAVNTTLSTLPPADDVPTYTDIQRIFNKSCIECHGGLGYPPYANLGSSLDLTENEFPAAGVSPMRRPHGIAEMRAMSLTGPIYRFINQTNEDCPPEGVGMMPCGGPPLSRVDIETIRRWIVGGHMYTEGDPHILTIDGGNYDFQSAGEFVLLRDETFEIQARQTPVGTDGPLGPNDHTGLTSCVSLNTAVALRVGDHRITYQPNLNGEPDPGGLQLRIDGKLTNMESREILLASGGRIIRTDAPGGIQIESPGGTIVVITPRLWDYYQVWFLDIDVQHARATNGVMGAIGPVGWLPALPDGTSLGPRPGDLHQRYVDLYDKFENAWRVTDATTLFDYAPGTSTVTFAVDSWPAENPKVCIAPPRQPGGPVAKAPLKKLALEVAQQHCGPIVDVARKANCVQDVMVTGEPGFAKAYLMTEQIERNAVPAPPVLGFPEDRKNNVAGPVTFTWNKAIDPDNNPVTYRPCVWRSDKNFTLNDCDRVPIQTTTSRRGGVFWALLVLLIGLLLLTILFFMGMRRRPALLGFVAVVILAAVILAFYVGRARTSSALVAKTVSGLESSKSYFWKVIAEDDKGGSAESETRRFTTK